MAATAKLNIIQSQNTEICHSKNPVVIDNNQHMCMSITLFNSLDNISNINKYKYAKKLIIVQLCKSAIR